MLIDPYKDAVSVRNPAGAVIVDGCHVADTCQCVHCGAHFQMVRGSGRIRGFCPGCNGITCGAPKCNPCVPFERALEIREKLGK